MANLNDYIVWRGDLTFEQAPFCELDAAVFSLFSYFDFEDIVSSRLEANAITMKDAARQYWSNCDNDKEPYKLAKGITHMPKEIWRMLRLMARADRYKDLKLSGYVNQIDFAEEKQFSAIVITIKRGLRVISFRGTDDTLVGWKEDFNMSFLDIIPAQKDALDYLEKASKKTLGEWILCGHSKGGNLAIFSCVYARESVQKRIRNVYSFDGPGLKEDIVDSQSYQGVKDKLRNYLPRFSVVGMMLRFDNNYQVVQSNQISLLQHNLFSWKVLRTKFIYAKDISIKSKAFDESLRKWFYNTDANQRKKFVDTIFYILEDSGRETLKDLNSRKALEVLKSITGVDEEVRTIVKQFLAILYETRKQNIEIRLRVTRDKK